MPPRVVDYACSLGEDGIAGPGGGPHATVRPALHSSVLRADACTYLGQPFEGTQHLVVIVGEVTHDDIRAAGLCK